MVAFVSRSESTASRIVKARCRDLQQWPSTTAADLWLADSFWTDTDNKICPSHELQKQSIILHHPFMRSTHNLLLEISKQAFRQHAYVMHFMLIFRLTNPAQTKIIPSKFWWYTQSAPSSTNWAVVFAVTLIKSWKVICQLIELLKIANIHISAACRK